MLDEVSERIPTSVTCPATFSPEAALIVTVADWPTSTLPMSDSLRETSSLSLESAASTMKALEEDEDEDALLPPAPPPPPEADADELEEPEPAVSPTSPEIEATVPAIGARSLVFSRSSWACLRARSALSTAACADWDAHRRPAAAAAGAAAAGDEPWLLLPPLRCRPRRRCAAGSAWRSRSVRLACGVADGFGVGEAFGPCGRRSGRSGVGVAVGVTCAAVATTAVVVAASRWPRWPSSPRWLRPPAPS